VHRLVVLYPPPTDPDHFRAHYVSTHVPLAAKIPGVLAYRYNFEVEPAPGSPPIFAVFEADFPDADTMRAGMTSPEGAATLADVPNYATGGLWSYSYPVDDAG
jgi:uncharacterized protein (TIGR02118 family)